MSNTPLTLTFIGSGDAFSSGGRLQSGIFLETTETGLLLDCGATLLTGLQRCGLTSDRIDSVAISHLHGDHFGGLPFLLLDALFVRQRRKPLKFYGPPGLEERCSELCRILYPGALTNPLPFPLDYEILQLRSPLQQESFSITALPASHSQQVGASSLRLGIAGRLIAYSGDTEWTEVLPELAKGTDLLICECCNYAEPLPSHLDYLTLQQHRSRLETARLILTHSGDSIDANRSRISDEIAYDGLQIHL